MSAQALGAGCLIEQRSTTIRKASRDLFQEVLTARRQPPTQILERAMKKRIRDNLASGATRVLVEREIVAPEFRKERFVFESAEVGDRLRAIEDTISKYEINPKSVSGAKELKELLPEHAAVLMAKLSDWLQLRPGAGTELPVVDTRNRIWGEIHEQAFAVLVDRNQLDGGPPALFQRGDRLVRVRVARSNAGRAECQQTDCSK